ncbi:hypothetical protein GCM10028824_18450 [Hymenobacter segetis]|uniref:T9SS type A sorting domain-containing protein n=1 Tax=Hymenobacter segetis TaxID=2025509 RepID=A0ABU9M1A3_9BACT
MKTILTQFLLPLLFLLGLCGQASAAAPPATAEGQPLAEALNPDGTLRAGTSGSFDARAFRLRTAPDGRPVFRPAGTAGAGDERWQDGFGMNGTDGSVLVVVSVGNDVYIGGGFTTVTQVAANNVAKWNGSAWTALGTGVNSTVRALAVAANGDVYAGGSFFRAGGAPANYVAKWNGTAWSPLGSGVNGQNILGVPVSALALAPNGDLYLGGGFTEVDGVPANGVARWNGSAWSSLSTGAANGTNGPVRALAVAANGDVYAGGSFTQAGGASANNVARWNGTAWSSLGTGSGNGITLSPGPSNAVFALAIGTNGDVYAGGSFTQAGGAAANNVAKWNGAAWNPLGSGMTAATDVTVYALAIGTNGDVYAGGVFTQAGGAAANNVAKWNGAAWSPLGSGMTAAFNSVRAFAVAPNGDLNVGGYFTQVDGVLANNVARWRGATWSTLGTGNGIDGLVYALAVAPNGDVYVGGSFTHAGGVPANNVAKWNGSAWSLLGSGATNGVNLSRNGVNIGYVGALAVAPNGDVYVGGGFTTAGGVPVSNVAKWNGTAWSGLGTGITGPAFTGTTVAALAVAANGDVYAGGAFTQAGGVAANNVARWNGSSWSAMGTGMDIPNIPVNASVSTLAMAANGEVYAGGSFTHAGGVPSNCIAKWNGTAWSPLGTGVTALGSTPGTISSLVVVAGGDVYVGGQFNAAGGMPASNVAKWNGTAWSNMGGGVSASSAASVAVAANGDVYVGGRFTTAGGISANNIAKWDGTAWSPLGTGVRIDPALYFPVSALAIGPAGKLYVGGGFITTGDGAKPMIHFGVYDPNALLATATASRVSPVALFPNPAHGTATLRLPPGAPHLPLTLTDAQGRSVQRAPTFTGPDAVLDLRGLPAGVYVVRCGNYSQRLVVE